MYLKQIFLIATFSLLLCLNSGQQKVSLHTIHGSVYLRNGTGVRDASLRLLDADRGTSISAAVNKTGRFTISGVPMGQYRLQISISGVLVYDAPLPSSALSGESLDVRLTDEKALSDVALLHPEATVDVTATRQTEDLLTSASSVSVVTRGELEARNVKLSTKDLIRFPGFMCSAYRDSPTRKLRLIYADSMVPIEPSCCSMANRLTIRFFEMFHGT